jgi:DNA polymerase-3 subunit epsilon
LRVPSLCSVRLSRKLYPQYKSHGLDAIIQRHGLHTNARHRAMGDVDMVLAWLAQAQAELGLPSLQEAATDLLQPPLGLPLQLETQVADIPDSPGVYLLYGEAPAPLFIGSATNLRQRVTEHLQVASKAATKSAKERAIVNNTQRIEWQETAGEIGALIQGKRLAERLKPTYGPSAKPRVTVDARALHAWPWPGPIGLREHHAETGRTDIHLFHAWCHLATVTDEQALAEFAEQPEALQAQPLDMDLYRMLVKQFKKNTQSSAKIFRIGNA